MKKRFSWNKVVLIIYIMSALYLLTAIITNDSIKLWLSIALGTLTYSYLIYLLWKRRHFKPIKGNCAVEFHDEYFECRFEDGTIYKMLWRDIQRITVNTVDSEDALLNSEIWIRLFSYPWRQVCSIPWRANEFQRFYNIISEYEGFRKDKISEAMGSTVAVNMTVWEKNN